MFPNQNARRRRSNLGRRSRIISGTEIPPLPAPVFAVPKVVTSGLGRSRSAKKTPLGKASKDYIARKRLFLNRSPMDGSINISSQSRPSPNLSTHSGDTLNLTGVRSINTPSPDTRSTSSQARNGSSSDVRPHVNPYLYDFSKPPLSPGPSKYDAIVRKELDSIKPPIDPGDNVHMKKYMESLKSSVRTQQPQVTVTSARSVSPLLEPSSSSYPRLKNNEERQPKGPLSPGPSKYEAIVSKELDSIKPPIDPGDNVHMKKYLESLKSSVRTQQPQVTVTSARTVSPLLEPSLSSYPRLKNNEERQPKGPLSPGPSKYEAIVSKELDSWKPSVNFGDNVLMKKYLESLKSSVQTQEPQDLFTSSRFDLPSLESSSSTCPRLENNEEHQPKENPSSLKKTACGSAKKLSVIEEDENNDEQSFILAEQTILGLNQTIKEPPTKNTESNPQEPLSIDPKGELQIALLAIDRGLANMEQTMKDMKALRITVQKLINEQQEQKSRETTGNKENVPVNIEQKWFASLKSGNPGLLKTPNMTRNRAKNSHFNQSAILTPHSLSTVLTDQMEDLFSDEYY